MKKEKENKIENTWYEDGNCRSVEQLKSCLAWNVHGSAKYFNSTCIIGDLRPVRFNGTDINEAIESAFDDTDVEKYVVEAIVEKLQRDGVIPKQMKEKSK